MSAHQYPVIAEHTLPRAGTKWGRKYRDVAALPAAPPGAVLVFSVAGAWHTLPEGAPSGREPVVVDASAVSVVDTRGRAVSVGLSLPSSDPADEFAVTVTFLCRVERPDQVAAAGLTDLGGVARRHVLGDGKLRELAAAFHVDELTNARHEITARIEAYCTRRSLEIAGISVDYEMTAVHTPQSLREHHRELRDRGRDHEVTRLDRDFAAEGRRATTEVIRSGVDAVLAQGMEDGDLTAAQVANVLLAQTNQDRERQAAAIKVLAELGHLDNLSATRVAELFAHRTTSDAAALLPGLDDTVRKVVDATPPVNGAGGASPNGDASGRTEDDEDEDDEDDDVPPVDDD